MSGLLLTAWTAYMIIGAVVSAICIVDTDDASDALFMAVVWPFILLGMIGRGAGRLILKLAKKFAK